MNIFIQGDRDTSGPEAEAVRQICELCAKSDITILTGAYGQIVKVAFESGAKVVSHSFRAGDKSKIPEGVEFVDCTSPDGDRARGWGIRIGELLAKSDGAIFLPGREGTLAHLMPFIAFAIKAKEKGSPQRIPVEYLAELIKAKEKGPEKRVALLGWEEDDFQALLSLFKFERRESPFLNFSLDQVHLAFNWVTGK